ncbi:hypothetical protein DESA109040_05880 [Deinococcus saxicola]|uniref:hypothetical protein n=1 Tax=Deinococcus saxicola TaxID=249406 RepID=UPI0039F07A62
MRLLPKNILERELRAALTLHAMSQGGGMGAGGYGSPALQLAHCTLDQLAWQQAVWTFSQARGTYREAWDLEHKREDPKK